MSTTAAPSSLVECLTGLASGKKSSGSGAHHVLINALFSIKLEEVERMLPQVVNVAVTHSCESDECILLLRKFLVHLASRSMYLGMRLCWLLESCSSQFEASEITRSRTLGLKESIKNAAVTHAIEAESSSSETEHRAEMFHKQFSFIRSLTKISAKLAGVADKTLRKSELRKELDVLNKNLKPREILFPLAASNDSVRWIVRIVASECVVFSSRERAPYLLLVETVADPRLNYVDPCNTIPTDLRSEVSSEVGGNSGALENATQEASIGLLSVVFGESSNERRVRLRKLSPFGDDPTWDLKAMVIKAGDDLRQEEFALQLISYFQHIWNDEGITARTEPYAAISTDPSSGLIQCVTDALSIDSVKKAAQVQSMSQFFVKAYGGEGNALFSEAQRNFIESMAAYSVICYLLQIKDRHNGNLMLSRSGHLIHIDFGFMLATSPGGINFESAPFKLSQELVDVMGGVNSPQFSYFRVLLWASFRAVRDRSDEILALVNLMVPQTTIPCFGSDPTSVVNQLRQRFKEGLSDIQLAAEIKQMVDISADNWRTRRYDQFQTWQNGII